MFRAFERSLDSIATPSEAASPDEPTDNDSDSASQYDNANLRREREERQARETAELEAHIDDLDRNMLRQYQTFDVPEPARQQLPITTTPAPMPEITVSQPILSTELQPAATSPLPVSNNAAPPVSQLTEIENEYRRPETETTTDYWYCSRAEWTKICDQYNLACKDKDKATQRSVLNQIRAFSAAGEICETSRSVITEFPCEQCVKANRTCMVFGPKEGSKSKSCAYCRRSHRAGCQAGVLGIGRPTTRRNNAETLTRLRSASKSAKTRTVIDMGDEEYNDGPQEEQPACTVSKAKAKAVKAPPKTPTSAKRKASQPVSETMTPSKRRTRASASTHSPQATHTLTLAAPVASAPVVSPAVTSAPVVSPAVTLSGYNEINDLRSQIASLRARTDGHDAQNLRAASDLALMEFCIMNRIGGVEARVGFIASSQELMSSAYNEVMDSARRLLGLLRARTVSVDDEAVNEPR